MQFVQISRLWLPLAIWAMASCLLQVLLAQPASAQAGRDGCYFGECPGGRPPPSAAPKVPVASPMPPPPRSKAPVSQSGGSSGAGNPSNKGKAPHTAAGPKIGGNFCAVINEVAGLVNTSFKKITRAPMPDKSLSVSRSLPGADLCGVLPPGETKGYVCLWQLGSGDLKPIVKSFVDTVSRCFDDAETDAVDNLTARISATDDADILVMADADSRMLTLVITDAAGDDEGDEDSK